MKKSLILVGMLAVGYANAQQGSVGINTETPQATMEIVPSKTNLEGTTNEGIIIPKLTKARVLAIATDKLVEGTKVYITDEVLASDNAKFQGTGKGFYFYNGTKWVKQLDSDANTELWAQRDNAGVTETYLKPADEKADFIGYTSNRKWGINLGNVEERDFDWEGGQKGFVASEIPMYSLISSDVLPSTTTIGGNSFYYFSNDNYLLKEAHLSQNMNKTYIGKEHNVQAKNLTSNANRIMGLNSSVNFVSNSNITSIVGFRGITGIGGVSVPNAVVTNNTAGEFIARNESTSHNMIGVDATANNQGIATNSIIGGRFRVYSSNGTTANTLSDLLGIRAVVENKTNATTDYIRGGYISTDLQTKSVSKETYGIDVRNFIKEDSQSDMVVGINSYVRVDGKATIKDIYGFRFHNMLNRDFTPTNMYGLYLADVKIATDKNYAIYANAGQVRFGDLKGTGNRNVYVDADGVLKAGEATATTVGNTDGIVCNADNVGKINYGDITLSDGRKVGAFGFCMKGTDASNNPTYGWKYLYGIEGVTSGSGAFGSGIQ